MISGPFTTEPFQEAGFECPRLSYALRNPLQIAKYAQDLVQNRAENLLHGVLKSPIEVSRTTTNIPDGQVIKHNNKNLPCLDALTKALKDIPSQNFAQGTFSRTCSTQRIHPNNHLLNRGLLVVRTVSG